MVRLIAAFCFLASTLMGAAQARAQERSWSLDTNETEAFLTFGVAESDDVGISFWCRMKSGQIRIFLPDANASLRPNRRTRIKFSVDGKTFRLQAKTLANEEAATTSIEALIDVGNPLFALLKQVDKFTIDVGTESQNFPLHGAEISGLLRVCAKS
jgi:hypothetical protein